MPYDSFMGHLITVDHQILSKLSGENKTVNIQPLVCKWSMPLRYV